MKNRLNNLKFVCHLTLLKDLEPWRRMFSYINQFFWIRTTSLAPELLPSFTDCLTLLQSFISDSIYVEVIGCSAILYINFIEVWKSYSPSVWVAIYITPFNNKACLVHSNQPACLNTCEHHQRSIISKNKCSRRHNVETTAVKSRQNIKTTSIVLDLVQCGETIHVDDSSSILWDAKLDNRRWRQISVRLILDLSQGGGRLQYAAETKQESKEFFLHIPIENI